MRSLLTLCGIAVSLASACVCSPLQAQGLLWSLPEDGRWVRYEGTYTQVSKQPLDNDAELNLNWIRKVTLKSVGSENGDVNGQSVPARWIEIKVETGRMKNEMFEIGPGGVQLYKLLVPEEAVRGTISRTVIDEREIQVGGIPILKGLRKSGEKDVVTLEAGVFQVYPVVALINHYPELNAAGNSESVSVPAGSYDATVETGELVTETLSSRSTSTCELTRSTEIPFGIVKWSATTVTETKGSTDVRSEFQEAVTTKEEMQAVEVGTGAESELTN